MFLIQCFKPLDVRHLKRHQKLAMSWKTYLFLPCLISYKSVQDVTLKSFRLCFFLTNGGGFSFLESKMSNDIKKNRVYGVIGITKAFIKKNVFYFSY